MRYKNRKIRGGLGILSILILVLYILLKKQEMNQNQETATGEKQEVYLNENAAISNELTPADKNKMEENQRVIQGETELGETKLGETKLGETKLGEKKPGETIPGKVEPNKKAPESLPALTIIDTSNTGEHFMEDYFVHYEILAKTYDRINGISYKTDCPVSIEELRYLTILYYGFDKETHIGEMIVNKSIAKEVIQIFKELYEAKYPIEKVQLVDEYNGDDILSMTANNTSSFNFRYIEGTTKYSNHSRGLAIDINPLYNPYVRYKDGVRKVLPVSGEEYADRNLDLEYYIQKDDICYEIFTKYGFTWGGDWKNSKDYQHFEKDVE